MKIAIIYHSESGNTKKQAELVEEGVKSVEGVEVKTMSIDDFDKEWCNESKALIFGSPTYEGTCSWQMKKFLDTATIKYTGKLAGFFATQNWPGGGGADFAEITMIVAALIHGMLIYSGGVKTGMPPTHFGAVSHKAPTTEFDHDRAVKIGKNIAEKAMEIF